MSDTRGNLRTNIRTLTGDISVDNSAFNDERINRSIEAYCQFISNDVYQGEAWVDPFIALASGTSDYQAPVAEYGQIVSLRLNSQNYLIEQVTSEIMEGFRIGLNATSSGDPTRFTMYEKTDQTLNFRFWPTPNKTDTVAALRTILVSTLTTDSAVIPFIQPLCRAIEFQVSADLVGTASDSQLEKLLVSTSSAGLWNGVAQRAIIKEKERQHRLRAVRSVVRQNSGVW